MRKRSLALASMVVLAAVLWWSTATARPVCVVAEAEPALASPPTLQLAGGAHCRGTRCAARSVGELPP